MRRSKQLAKKNVRRIKRKRKIRGRISGNAVQPRVTIYKSNRFLIVQAIDDANGNTLAYLNTAHLEEKIPSNIEGAKKTAALFADKLKQAEIEKISFDRNGYKYHGVVAAFADSLRDNGIKL